MDQPPQVPPDEIYRPSSGKRRKRRKHGKRRRLPKRFVIVLTTALLCLPMAWMWYHYSNRRPPIVPPDPGKSKERLALVASVNKSVAQTGKDVPLADLVVVRASMHGLDGRNYL